MSEDVRDVISIGAGPAGLTAAYEAAELGHEVTLFEKRDKVGGQLRYAGHAPHNGVYNRWIGWLAGLVETRAAVRTGTEVTPSMIEQ